MINRESRSFDIVEVEVMKLNRMPTRDWVFCPILKARCRTNCESFVKARANLVDYDQKTNEPLFAIVGFYCEHKAMHGGRD